MAAMPSGDLERFAGKPGPVMREMPILAQLQGWHRQFDYLDQAAMLRFVFFFLLSSQTCTIKVKWIKDVLNVFKNMS